MVLASSDYNFPAYLSSSPLNFDLHSFTQILYMHEIPPQDIYKVLTSQWHLGHHLSCLLIGFCGGDLEAIYQALYRLNLISQYHHQATHTSVDYDAEHDEGGMLRQEFVSFPLLNAHHAQAVQTVMAQCREQGTAG
ncbi:hypothetical protein EON63_01625 [archaeon]|nr:MAG: hypothetical protein EON63_01625 [archaeon]